MRKNTMMAKDYAGDYAAIRARMRDIMIESSVKTEIGVPKYREEAMEGDPKGKAWPRFTYVVAFKGKRGSMCVDYSVGADKKETGRDRLSGRLDPIPKHEKRPKAEEVLSAVCREALDAREASFEEWASNLGYDADSRKAEKVYNLCAARWHELCRLPLSPSQITELAELAWQL
jgi:hypothetical protein